MGMYTEVFMRGELAADTATEVLHILHAIFQGEEPHTKPDHPFFETPSYMSLFLGHSAYFPAPFKSRAVVSDFGGHWEIGIHASLKNYDDEIEKFFDWIDPYLYESPGQFLGYSLYEESDNPRLFYKKDVD